MKFFYYVLVCCSVTCFSQKYFEIKILHVNDMHGKIDKMPYLATLVKSIRSEYKNVLLVSAGDIFSGNPVVDKHYEKGYPIIHLMNEIGFDISVLGNHEFDFGPTILQKRIKELKHTVLATNIVEFPPEFSKLEPFKVVEVYNIPIIFLGLTNVSDNGYPDTHIENVKGFKFETQEKTIKRYKSLLKKYPIRIIISHSGYEIDSLLAVKFPFLTAIIGGHSHKIINGTKKINGVLIAQAGNYLNYLGILTLKMKNKKIVSISDTLIPISENIKPDSTIIGIVDSYNKNPEFSQVLINFPIQLLDKNAIGTFMANCYKNILKTDFAIQNNGGVRISKIDTGKFTLKNLYELDPFSNQLFICTLSVNEIKDIISYGYNKEQCLDIYSAGFYSSIFLDKHKKITKIDIYDENNNLLLDNNKYTVAIGSYLVTRYCANCRNNCVKTNVNTTYAIKETLEKIDYSSIIKYSKHSTNIMLSD
ncbi:MAG: bifunctional metallophosphatase/5'-nucleotidase [Bacteroidales bacterium]|nr:bifunctional metallophosphatase/5'-nucleotidase [Bacteroidales bacterium]